MALTTVTGEQLSHDDLNKIAQDIVLTRLKGLSADTAQICCDMMKELIPCHSYVSKKSISDTGFIGENETERHFRTHQKSPT